MKPSSFSQEIWVVIVVLIGLTITKVESEASNVVKLNAKGKLPDFRDAENSLHAVQFVKLDNKFLDSQITESHFVKNFNACLIACAANHICISANFANIPQANGEHQCALMDVGLYKNASKLRIDSGFTFINVKKKCFYSPCKNGGTCIPVDYKLDTYTCKCPLDTKGRHCEVAMVPLGMEDGRILDSQITASSILKLAFSTAEARLIVGDGWAPNVNVGEYLQIDLGTEKQITKVATQGRKTSYPHYVSKYSLKYKVGATWVTYQENSVDKIFNGNYDRTTVVSHVLVNPINTTAVQFIVLAWNPDWPNPVMRVELYSWP